jgi:hypothetical protein
MFKSVRVIGMGQVLSNLFCIKIAICWCCNFSPLFGPHKVTEYHLLLLLLLLLLTTTTTTTTTTTAAAAAAKRNPLKCETVPIFGNTLTNQNSIHEEIKNRSKSGSACGAES